MEFRTVVARRRSHREYAGIPLSRSQIDELLSVAILAPNHKRNQPWRFTVIEAEALPRFWRELAPLFPEALAGREPHEIEAKRNKLSEKIPSLGAIIHVTVLADANPLRERENYAATCCAIQNMLLAATDMGLGAFWNTSGIFASPACARLLGIPAEERFVGSVWFGQAKDEPAAPVYELGPRVRFWRHK